MSMVFTDDAFRPKSYSVRIEKGNFIEPCYIGSSGPPEATAVSLYRPRYALRLVFDKLPYPHDVSGGSRREAGGQFWDHKEFVGRSSPELKTRGRAMNDLALAGWGRHLRGLLVVRICLAILRREIVRSGLVFCLPRPLSRNTSSRYTYQEDYY
jgi:hypothetical protein